MIWAVHDMTRGDLLNWKRVDSDKIEGKNCNDQCGGTGCPLVINIYIAQCDIEHSIWWFVLFSHLLRMFLKISCPALVGQKYVVDAADVVSVVAVWFCFSALLFFSDNVFLRCITRQLMKLGTICCIWCDCCASIITLVKRKELVSLRLNVRLRFLLFMFLKVRHFMWNFF